MTPAGRKLLSKARGRYQHTKPVEELRKDVEEDLSKVLNSPLRPARRSGYGCLPSEVVQPLCRLHEVLLRTVGPAGDQDLLDDADTATDPYYRVQAFVTSVDPDHPFLKVEFEFEGSQADDGDDE